MTEAVHPHVPSDGSEYSAPIAGAVPIESEHTPYFAQGRVAIAFVAAAFALQIGLFTLGNTPLRLPLRCGVYGLSVGLMYLTRGRSRPHPAWRWGELAIVFLLFGALNPSGDGPIARVACIVLYTSVLAPLLWVGRLKVRPIDFRNVVRLMWVFYTASAVFGVLQINYPGRYDGALSENYNEQSLLRDAFTLADGRKYLRPKGLTDTPGGASSGSVNAIILGAGLLLTETNVLVKGLTLGGMVVGLFCVYICEVRVNLVIIGLALAVLLVTLIVRGMVRQATTLLSVVGVASVIGTTVAFSVGGASTVNRFYTLIASDPGTVVHENRGEFVDQIVDHDAYTYPFGAGEGRWGMVSSYFGTPSRAIWAEMLWQALLYDGGIPLMAVYAALFASLMWTAWRLAIRRGSDEVMCCWAGVILGYDLAALAASFVFPILALQVGMEVILLNACLYAACASKGEEMAASRLPGSRGYAIGGELFQAGS